MLERVATNGSQCTMGVDTGKDLHVVVSRRIPDDRDHRQVVYIGIARTYAECRLHAINFSVEFGGLLRAEEAA